MSWADDFTRAERHYEAQVPQDEDGDEYCETHGHAWICAPSKGDVNVIRCRRCGKEWPSD